MCFNSLRMSCRTIVVLLSVIALILASSPVYALAAFDDPVRVDLADDLPTSGSWGTCPWEINEVGRLSIYPGIGDDTNGESPWVGYGDKIKSVVFMQAGDAKVVAPADISGLLSIQSTDMYGNFNSGNFIEAIDLSGFDTAQAENMSGVFMYCSLIRGLRLSGLNTSRVTDMSRMFEWCTSLSSLDLSGFDTSQVTDMSYMFDRCETLSSLDLSGFETSQVTDMTWLFSSCSSLSSLDVSAFNTSRVTSMQAMFAFCSNLTTIDVSGFDTSNVQNMGTLFQGCGSLEYLDLRGFNTSQVTQMTGMFEACRSLSSLDLTSFNTSKVEYFGYLNLGMFRDCQSLQSLNLSNFDTSSAKNMSGMFLGCTNLQFLNIDSFDTSNVQDMQSMFNGCASLRSLDLSSFEITEKALRPAMFKNCDNLNTVTLGQKFAFPSYSSAYLPEGNWRSLANGAVYSSQQIAETRSGIADTYTTLEKPRINGSTELFWHQDSEDGVVVSASAPGAQFVGVRIDGKRLDPDNYVVTGDSLSIELTSSYLGSLDEGKHGVEIVFSSGTAEGSITIGTAIDSSIVEKGTWGTCPWEIDADGVLAIHPGVGEDTYGKPPWSGEYDKIKKVVFLEENGEKVVAPEDVSNLFLSSTVPASQIESFDLSGLDTSRVKKMEGFFEGNEKLQEVTVGSDFSFKGDAETVQTILPAGYYLSSKDGKAFTAQEIAENRGNIADTYTKLAAPRIDGTSEITWKMGSSDKAVFSINSSFLLLDEIRVDGDPLDPKNYVLAGEPASVEFAHEYLAILSGGKHAIEFVFQHGIAPAVLNVAKAEEQKPGDNQSSGDNQPGQSTSAETQTMFRMYNPNSGEHFYTAAAAERDNLVKVGWKFEGTAWTAPKKSDTPVYRLYSGTDHHYTTNAGERDNLVKAGWSYEGIGWYSDDSKGVVLYRLFNPNVDPSAATNNSGSHHYTTSAAERDHLKTVGWKDEGEAWHGVK